MWPGWKKRTAQRSCINEDAGCIRRRECKSKKTLRPIKERVGVGKAICQSTPYDEDVLLGGCVWCNLHASPCKAQRGGPSQMRPIRVGQGWVAQPHLIYLPLHLHVCQVNLGWQTGTSWSFFMLCWKNILSCIYNNSLYMVYLQVFGSSPAVDFKRRGG